MFFIQDEFIKIKRLDLLLPLLDDSYYAYWNLRTETFINTLEEKVWRAVLIRQAHPTKEHDKRKKIPKLELEWSANEVRLGNKNLKALNATFNDLDQNQFKLNSTCDTTMDTRENQQTSHEGTNFAMLSKLQILTTRYENLRMKDEEMIVDFNT